MSIIDNLKLGETLRKYRAVRTAGIADDDIDRDIGMNHPARMCTLVEKLEGEFDDGRGKFAHIETISEVPKALEGQSSRGDIEYEGSKDSREFTANNSPVGAKAPVVKIAHGRGASDLHDKHRAKIDDGKGVGRAFLKRRNRPTDPIYPSKLHLEMH